MASLAISCTCGYANPGAFGEIFEATDVTSNEIVAIKFERWDSKRAGAPSRAAKGLECDGQPELAGSGLHLVTAGRNSLKTKSL